MTKLRIPTKDTYAFVEIDTENLEALEVKKIYDDYMAVFNPQPMTAYLTDYLINLFNEDLDKGAWAKMSPEEYMELSENHKALLQSIKRFYKRLPRE